MEFHLNGKVTRLASALTQLSARYISPGIDPILTAMGDPCFGWLQRIHNTYNINGQSPASNLRLGVMDTRCGILGYDVADEASLSLAP